MVDLSIDTSAIVDTQTADAADVTTPFSDVETHLENILNGVQQFDQLRLNTATELTIATGAITVSKSYHQVDTESDAASDDLDTISGGSAGDVLYITSAADARTVVVKHNTGNILTWDTNDISLDNTRKCLELLFDGTDWRVLSVIGGTSGADTALSNLASVAINTSLISDTDSTDNLGSTGIYWANSYIDTMYISEQSAPSTPATGKGVVYPKTDGLLYFKNDGGTEYDLTNSGTGLYTSIAILTDEKATGTDGGGASATTWNARDLNTEQSDPDNIVSIASNEFTPISGTYVMFAYAPGLNVVGHRLRLYNVTGASVVQEGSNADNVSGSSSHAMLSCRFSANGTDAFRIDHYTEAARATDGLGDAADDGSPEIYLVIKLEKEA